MNSYYFTETKWYGPLEELRADESSSRWNEQIESLPSGPSLIPQFAGMVKEQGKDFKWKYQCPACGGDGKETCHNPDHNFIQAVLGEIGRLGCPVCGHDPDHKVNGGKNVCPECGGYGLVIPEVFEEYGREYGYDEEPIQTAVPVAEEKLSWQEEVIVREEEGKQTFSAEERPEIANAALKRVYADIETSGEFRSTWVNGYCQALRDFNIGT